MKPALIAIIGLAAAACAPSAEIAASARPEAQSNVRQCFDVDRVRNFSAGERTGVLYVRPHGQGAPAFEISTPGCWITDTTIQLGLRAPGVGNSRVCVGDAVNVIAPAGFRDRPETCRATVVRALGPADVEALPERSRP